MISTLLKPFGPFEYSFQSKKTEHLENSNISLSTIKTWASTLDWQVDMKIMGLFKILY